MSKEQKYMETEGNVCPHCGSGDISGGNFEAEGLYVWRNVECDNCDTTWNENFKMTGIDL
jgi:formate dehydrogenase maturation protein FdhE